MLRFILGVVAECPDICSKILSANGKYKILIIITLIASIWAYGSYSAIMPWVEEVCLIVQQKGINLNSVKKHYSKMYCIIECNYKLAEKKPMNNKSMPLRQKGTLKEIWNVYFLFAVSGMELTAFLCNKKYFNSNVIFYSIMTIALCIMLLRFVKGIGIVVNTFFINSVIIFKMFITGSIFSIVGLLYCIQGLFVITYFVLRYTPQLKNGI